jgi:HEAT repeat protein
LQYQKRLRNLLLSFRKKPSVSEMRSNQDVDGLIQFIVYPANVEKNSLRNAVKALGDIGDPKAVDALITLLDVKDKQIRRQIVESLGKIGDAKACIPLIKTLEDEDIEVRRRSVKALEIIHDPQCIPALIGMLRENNRFLREDVINTLAFFGEDAILLLNEALSVENVNVNMGALTALREMGQLAIQQLIRNLKDPDEGVRWGAAYALGKLQSLQAVEPLHDAIHDSDNMVRTAAVVSLGIIGDEQSIIALSVALVDENPDVRKASSEALQGLGVTEEDALLLAINSKKNEIREKAARGLGSLPDERSMKALLVACRDPKPEVRSAAIESLGRLGTDLVVPEILNAVRDPELIVRHAANRVIRDLKIKIEHLTKDLATNNNRRLMSTERTIEAFGIITVEPLIKALDDFLELSDEERLLEKSAEGGDRLRALYELHEQAAKSIAKILQNITGNYFGLNVRAWQQWWQDNSDNYLS